MKHMCYNSLVSTHSPLESFRKNGRVRGAHPAHVHFPKAEGAGGLPAKVIFAQHATLKVADAECYILGAKMASVLLAAKILFFRAWDEGVMRSIA
jgi:hypothetical protein